MYSEYFVYMTKKFFVVVFVALLAILCASVVATQDLDIKGIPEPEFGINEAAPSMPSDWRQETLGFYYIDRQHSQATDTNNQYGTPQRPRRSIPGTLAAGSVVRISGEYDFPPSATSSEIVGQGTVENPIFILGPAVVTRAVVIRGSYVVLENLEFADANGDLSEGHTGRIDIIGDADHIVLRNNNIQGNLANGGVFIGVRNAQPDTDGITDGSDPEARDIVIFNNQIHHNGDMQSSSHIHGVHIGSYAHHVWIADNDIYSNGGDGVHINAGHIDLQHTTYQIYVGKNDVHDNKDSGLWTKQATDIVFSENLVYNHQKKAGTLGACVGYQFAPDNLWIMYNRLHDCTYGIGSSRDENQGVGTDVYMIGNNIHDIHGNGDDIYSSAGILVNGGRNTQVIGNVISQADAGINVPKIGTHYFGSNVIADVAGNHIAISESGTDWEITRNVFYNENNPVSIMIRTQVYNVPQLEQQFASATKNMVADPQITDNQLSASSPIFTIGYDPDYFEAFQSAFGVELSRLFSADNNNTETPAEETPAEETPAEETPAEETPAEETQEQPDQNESEIPAELNEGNVSQANESAENPEQTSQTVQSSDYQPQSQSQSETQQSSTPLPELRRSRSSNNNDRDESIDDDSIENIRYDQTDEMNFYMQPVPQPQKVVADGASVYVIPAQNQPSRPIKTAQRKSTNWLYPSLLAMDMVVIFMVGMFVGRAPPNSRTH